MTEHFPQDRSYTVEHQWVDEALPARVGVTWTAQDALGDVVYLDLPAVGSTVTAGAVVGEIESTKSVSDLFSPVSGTVTEVNQAALADPSVVNADPYGEGWLFTVAEPERGEVLTAEQYRARFE